MRAAFLFLLAFLAAAQARTLLAVDGKPATPPFEVKNSTKSIEVRVYENATWAVAFGKSRWSIDFAAQSAGIALARYFKGGNVAHTPIEPTVPLIGTILKPHEHRPHHKDGSHHGHHGNGSHPEPPHHKNGSHHGPPHHKPHHPPGPPAVALSAYIPAKYEGNAPIPDCPRVKIIHTNATEVYVHKFGGWAISWVVQHEIKHLALALKDLGICPKKGKFFVATYDTPFKIFGRHNEILFVKKPKHAHHNDTEAVGENMMGWEALDVEALFPAEFPSKDESDQDFIDDSQPSEVFEEIFGEIEGDKPLETQQEEAGTLDHDFVAENSEIQTA